MATATNQSLLDGQTGKIGPYVTREMNGRTIISIAPKGRTKKSDREKGNHGHFQQASAFAKASMLEPELKAYFQQVAKNRKLSNAYTAALSLKLRALKAEAKEEHRKLLTPSTEIQACTAVSDGPANASTFDRICHDTGKTLEDALSTVTTTWRNLDQLELDEKQKEVLRTILREQIRQRLYFV